MILIILATLCLISVPLTGGSLSRLTNLHLRCMWIAPLALGLQVAIITIVPGGHPALHSAIHIATYGFALIFLLANIRVPGVPLITAGTLANAVAITTNYGIMPASAAAQRLANLTQTSGFHNSAHVSHPHLLWLGDIIPIPGPQPLGNVFSIGDCVIFTGMLLLLHRTCGKATAAAPAARELS